MSQSSTRPAAALCRSHWAITTSVLLVEPFTVETFRRTQLYVLRLSACSRARSTLPVTVTSVVHPPAGAAPPPAPVFPSIV
jgi:hypothetical protein